MKHSVTRSFIATPLALLALFALPFVVTGCEEKKAAADSEQHASDDAVPGSYEDWCGEHAVPESQCTQCHKELIAAFKATGDWCDKHGMPTSHCKKCNPDLVIPRPPKPSETQ